MIHIISAFCVGAFAGIGVLIQLIIFWAIKVSPSPSKPSTIFLWQMMIALSVANLTLIYAFVNLLNLAWESLRS